MLLNIYASINHVHCRKKLCWRGRKAVLIYGYKGKYLEGSLILHSFDKMIVAQDGSELRAYELLSHGSWAGLQWQAKFHTLEYIQSESSWWPHDIHTTITPWAYLGCPAIITAHRVHGCWRLSSLRSPESSVTVEASQQGESFQVRTSLISPYPVTQV